WRSPSIYQCKFPSFNTKSVSPSVNLPATAHGCGEAFSVTGSDSGRDPSSYRQSVCPRQGSRRSSVTDLGCLKDHSKNEGWATYIARMKREDCLLTCCSQHGQKRLRLLNA